MWRIVAAVLLGGAASASAGDSRWWDVFCPKLIKLPLCCPDDYRCKPKPLLPEPYCPCGCDDYCGKPRPCLPPEYRPCGCDDYCGKPPIALPCDTPGKCYPTDGGKPRSGCWWLKSPWWGRSLCDR